MDERPMTDGELENIEKRVAAASPGPWMKNGKTQAGWRIDDCDPNKMGMAMLLNPVAIVPTDQNAEFIAEARYDVECLVVEVKRLRIRCRGFQIMARMTADIVSSGTIATDLEAGRYERVSGEVECSECRLLYREHPQLPKMPTFHITCLGKIVKT